MRSFLLLLSTLLFSYFASASVFNISSRYYTNQSHTELTSVSGTAFLVCLISPGYVFINTDNVGCPKYYLVTASHVSQGEEGKIKLTQISTDNKITTLIDYADQSMILGRLTDNWSDVEIIELSTEFVLKNNLSPLVYSKLNSYYNFSNIFVVNQATKTISKKSFSYNFVDYYFSLLKDNNLHFLCLFPNKELFDSISSEQKNLNSTVFSDFAEYHIKIANTLTPGTSGSPLLVEVNNSSNYYLKGVGIQYDNFFKESVFVSEMPIRILMDDYTNGKKGFVGTENPIWKIKNGKLVRSWRSFTETKDQFVGGKGDVGKMESNEVATANNSLSESELSFNGKNIVGLKTQLNNENKSDYLWASFSSLILFQNKNIEEIKTRLLYEEDINQNILVQMLKDKYEAQHSSFFGELFGFTYKTETIPYGSENTKSLKECNLKISEDKSKLELILKDKNDQDTTATINLSEKLKTQFIFNDTNGSYKFDIKQFFFTDLLDLPFVGKPNEEAEIYPNGLILKYQKIKPEVSSVGYINCNLED